jgi:fibronectin type 3 domain-containing protein
MSVRPLIATAMILALAMLCFVPSISATENPSGLQASTDVGYVDLNWQTVPGADNYYVYRGSESGMTQVANITAPFTAYHDGDVDQGSNYLYYVTAWDNGTESAPSNTISITVPVKEEANLILPVLAIVLSIIAVQVCIVMLLYFSKQKMQMK